MKKSLFLIASFILIHSPSLFAAGKTTAADEMNKKTAAQPPAAAPASAAAAKAATGSGTSTTNNSSSSTASAAASASANRATGKQLITERLCKTANFFTVEANGQTHVSFCLGFGDNSKEVAEKHLANFNFKHNLRNATIEYLQTLNKSAHQALFTFTNNADEHISPLTLLLNTAAPSPSSNGKDQKS